MNDKELIERVKNNDEFACKEMFDNYHKMIHSIINDYNLEYGDYLVSREDLYQEALIALYDACFVYKDNMNTKFSTFAYLVIKRRIQRCYKKQMYKYINETFSIDNMELVDHRKEFQSYYVSDNPVEYHRQEEIRAHLKELNDLDRQIITLRLENYSYSEIAEKLKINKKKVDNRLYNLKKKYLKNEK